MFIVFLCVFVVCVLGGRFVSLDLLIPPEKRYFGPSIHIVQRLENSPALNGFRGRKQIKTDESNVDSPIIYPIDYGADPTGRSDSTEAFEKCITVLLSHFTNHSLAEGAKDLGGATIDLLGGQYVISRPLIIPSYYGNFFIKDGTIRASKSFPKENYIIQIGTSLDKCTNHQGSCNENFGIEDIFFDCNYISAGALYIGTTMGSHISGCFFYAFTFRAIFLDAGHETMIDMCWFAEYFYGDSRKGSQENSTAIYLAGHDMYVTNTIIFSAKIGIETTHQAELISGVHCWNGGKGHISFYMSNPGWTQVRILGSYSDFVDIVAISPHELVISDSFFLDAGLILKSDDKVKKIDKLVVKDNQFNSPDTKDIIVLDGVFSNGVTNTVIKENVVDSGNRHSGNLKASVFSKTLYHLDSNEWTFDFSDVLLFDDIVTVEYSIMVHDDKFVRHMATPPNGKKVTIKTDEKCSATVFVRVDQSLQTV